MSLSETHVSNNQFFRAISDILDNVYFKPNSSNGHPSQRAMIHGIFQAPIKFPGIFFQEMF